MASNWTPMSAELLNNPKVLRIVSQLGSSVDDVLGKLFRFWVWAQLQTADGDLPSYTLELIADAAHLPVEFLQALVSVGWLEITESGARIPRFDRWLSRQSRRRLQDRERKRRQRAAARAASGESPEPVHPESGQNADKCPHHLRTNVRTACGQTSAPHADKSPHHLRTNVRTACGQMSASLADKCPHQERTNSRKMTEPVAATGDTTKAQKGLAAASEAGNEADLASREIAPSSTSRDNNNNTGCNSKREGSSSKTTYSQDRKKTLSTSTVSRETTYAQEAKKNKLPSVGNNNITFCPELKFDDDSAAKSADSDTADTTDTTPLQDHQPPAPTSPGSPAGAAAASEPNDDEVVLVFPVIGSDVKEWSLTRSKLDEYQETFPDLDVEAEARKALQWVRDNPSRRKTARGMPRFLNGWFARAQDSGRGVRRLAREPASKQSKNGKRNGTFDRLEEILAPIAEGKNPWEL